MKTVKIKFLSDEDRIKGLMELTKNTTVRGFKGNIFEIKEEDRKFLNKLKLKYRKLTKDETLNTFKMNLLHYPKLDTYISVEKIIKEVNIPVSKNEIDKRLPKQIMRPDLDLILKYLEDSGKIAILKDSILWIYKEDISNKLKTKLKRAVTVT